MTTDDVKAALAALANPWDRPHEAGQEFMGPAAVGFEAGRDAALAALPSDAVLVTPDRYLDLDDPATAAKLHQHDWDCLLPGHTNELEGCPECAHILAALRKPTAGEEPS